MRRSWALKAVSIYSQSFHVDAVREKKHYLNERFASTASVPFVESIMIRQ
jgi:hypothetical protein